MQKRMFWRRFLFGAAVLCALLALCGCSVEKMSTLPELAKPYLGMYECKELKIGGKDFSENFEKIVLELDYGGGFTLFYRDKTGGEGGYSGDYRADPEGEKITFSAKTGLRTSSYTFPMKNGKIVVDYNFHGKLLHAVFSAP